MRTTFIAVIVMIGATVGVGWYVFAQTPPTVPAPLPSFPANSVLTSAGLNALVDRINAIVALIDDELNFTPVTISVNCDAGETITQALQDTEGGDTIQITGTCNETVDISFDGLILDGQGSTIIDAGGASLPIVAIAGARNVTIRDITVQNGDLGILGTDGAALRLEGVTVQNTVKEGIRIEDNSTGHLSNSSVTNSGLDGIAVINNSSAVFEGTITSNTNGNDGLRVLQNSSISSLAMASITLDNNMGFGLLVQNSSTFNDFNATLSANNNQNAGVGVFDASSANLNADISNNIGNGIIVESSNATIMNATINGNSAGGIVLANVCHGLIENTMITSNGNDGIFVTDGCSAEIRNATVTNNSALGVSIQDARARIEMSTIQNNLDSTTDLVVTFGGRLTIDTVTQGNFIRSIICDATALTRDTIGGSPLSGCPS